MKSNEIIKNEADTVLQTYVRPEIVLTRGEGAYLFDTEGKRYLDFSSGIAVTALGHSDPEWVTAVQEQAAALVHVSNLYHTEPQVALAGRLVANSFADRVYFGNTGAEANEAAFKFARKFARQQHPGAGKDRDRGLQRQFSRPYHGRPVRDLQREISCAVRAACAGRRLCSFQ